MAIAQEAGQIQTLADVWTRLGRIPLDRVLFRPLPGTAVEEDVLRLHDSENRLAELVDGILVEKPMGYVESLVAALLIRVIGAYVEQAGLGIVAATDGMMRIATGLVRMPDVSVVLWQRLPGRRIPLEPIPSLAPDLAVEVLSVSNTAAEMDRKVSEYFAAGCQCVWLVDPSDRTVARYDSPSDPIVLTGDDAVTAEAVVPGFAISVSEIFRRSLPQG